MEQALRDSIRMLIDSLVMAAKAGSDDAAKAQVRDQVVEALQTAAAPLGINVAPEAEDC